VATTSPSLLQTALDAPKMQPKYASTSASHSDEPFHEVQANSHKGAVTVPLFEQTLPATILTKWSQTPLQSTSPVAAPSVDGSATEGVFSEDEVLEQPTIATVRPSVKQGPLLRPNRIMGYSPSIVVHRIASVWKIKDFAPRSGAEHRLVVA
jgi:hypothetical protein